MKKYYLCIAISILFLLAYDGQSKLPQKNQGSAPIYNISLQKSPLQRYNQLSNRKSVEIIQFLDEVFSIPKFRYTLYLTRFIYFIVPNQWIRQYIGQQFYDQCSGIANTIQRSLQQIIIGAAKDFCTSIAISQVGNHNLSMLARNLDYGFQQYLSKNTVQLDYYKQQQDKSVKVYTKITHAGFVGSHTILKYKHNNQIKFAVSLNQRTSPSLVLTLYNILFTQCQSIFQLLNRILSQQIQSSQQLIQKLSLANSCSNAYFIIHTESQDNFVIQKNHGIGVNQVYTQKRLNGNNTLFMVQTNTDRDKQDPDNRRTSATNKIQALLDKNKQITKDNIKNILLESPNFNNLTLMTALIDIQTQEIQTIIWSK